MKKTIWIATNNKNKIKEFKFILKEFNINSLDDFQKDLDIIEDGDTFEKNALIKARYLAKHVQGIIIADDSGLCINNLNDFPGVNSKRWVGNDIKNWDEINNKLLDIIQQNNLITVEQRKAHFNCTLALIDTTTQKEKIFTGIVEGHIALYQDGNDGFAYDKIFIPNGYKDTFARLGFEIKQKLSHRSIALNQLKEYLENI
ncbi:dITP/XTP pyrophosphatase [Spiroplasma gladiatoris]|uniref:dITP/XTP pyrophosphatase n=1 Tax=Spiroplasma gladiatoris TaxID=2143 RepID=A0A4P7AGT1_9MOLU|nr:RdgB/HAM1 family non-canonical purine NTP pyrophosphatase [Spiroplasma gladiatoris]QBQ07624.1 dITP/XTP pyrophosphatase [Spiroplasma gladiatoris]